MGFAEKSMHVRIFQKATYKLGGSAMSYNKIFQNAQTLSVSVGNTYSE